MTIHTTEVLVTIAVVVDARMGWPGWEGWTSARWDRRVSGQSALTQRCYCSARLGKQQPGCGARCVAGRLGAARDFLSLVKTFFSEICKHEGVLQAELASADNTWDAGGLDGGLWIGLSIGLWSGAWIGAWFPALWRAAWSELLQATAFSTSTASTTSSTTAASTTARRGVNTGLEQYPANCNSSPASSSGVGCKRSLSNSRSYQVARDHGAPQP
ncbi:hypothetical protein EDC01DRAFT_515952 [Geopyxis carbonaria]|nr:hypothetical protein EDC01DRAFT_515952 [Geopyxis carbonaria]